MRTLRERQCATSATARPILRHLTGRHVMGVYPLRDDETCWFLAADFDKRSWRDDVRAFIETCRHVGLPAAVEKSRSGNGAHVWFFFSAPVPASIARRVGCYLITETMSRRHELSMDSYDRLFPSQDTMPRGGFENLIALPFQHEPRQRQNSVFLDDQMEPYPDNQQWAYLASVPRIDPSTLDLIARAATQQGSVVGVQRVETADEEDAHWKNAYRTFKRAFGIPILPFVLDNRGYNEVPLRLSHNTEPLRHTS